VAHFSYTAEKSDGEVYSGVADVGDRFELYQVIRREGGRLLHLTDESQGSIWSLAYWNAKLTRVSEQQKIIFTRNLGSMLSAGLSLSRALSVLERQTKNPRLKMVVSQIGSEVRRGQTLHVSLSKFPHVFSKLIVAMVRAGEESGDLASSLKLTADQMDRMHGLKKKIRSAMFYPAIVLTVVVGIGALMMIFVVPTLTATFSAVKESLPISTQIIIGISNALVAHTYGALASVVFFISLIYIALHSVAGKRTFSWVFLRLPLIGEMVREVNAARTARSLASLVASGVDVLTALDITREVVQNPYFQEVLVAASKQVGEGQALSATFMQHEDLYPPLVGEMMAVGEETGQTADMLKNLAVFYEDEVDRKTKDMSTIIEPFLMLFIGAAVGFFALSIITPIYQVTQSIG
jgi:type IV pilus assembly protein PilC